MKKAEFIPELITGNEIIDDQHGAMIEAINSLYAALECGKGTEKAEEALRFLTLYTVFHFGGEENLWQEVGYPEYGKHKAAHDAFVEVVKELHDDLAAGGATEAFAERVEQEVTKWFLEHIQGMDLQAIKWARFHAGKQLHDII
ncbi:MAG: hemerythrin family protein [Acidaminococcaceae bacterium]|nr:hemerythrin family protein [Acidaminococcaceae bacterium]